MTEDEVARRKIQLPQRAHKHFPKAIEPDLISLNPVLELVAVATTEKQVDVFRFGGQRAFGTRAHRDKPSIAAICWKFDGSELALWWSDSTWQTIESSTGVVGPLMASFCEHGPQPRKIDFATSQAKIISPSIERRVAIAHGEKTDSANSTSSYDANVYLNDDEDKSNVAVEDMLSLSASEESSHTSVDHLPTLLASFTIRDELPRLSALPHVTNHDLSPHSESIINILSRQELIDRIINLVGSGLSDTMDFLAVGYGGAHLSIGSSKFGLCCMNLPNVTNVEKEYKLIGYASHPSASCQAVISSASAVDNNGEQLSSSLNVSFSSLNVIQHSGHYLPLIVQSVSQLIMLDRYIAFSIAAIREAWKGAREVFSRYMQSIQETLSEKDAADRTRMDIVTALYRLAVTGHCEPAVEEWMKDIMGLKGVERWNNALPGGIVHVIDLIHGNLLPALDRASIESSRLRAMCRNRKAPICHLSEKNLGQILDDLDIIRLLGNSALFYARQEIPQIEAFATFMRCQIQIMKEPDSSAAKEAIDTIAGLDHALLLSFITGPMTRSHLNVFLGRDVTMIRNAPRRPKQQAPKRIILSMLDRHSQNPMQTTTPVVEFFNLLYQSFFLSDTVRETQAQLVVQFAGASVSAPQISLDWAGMSSATDIRMSFRKPDFHDQSGSLFPTQEEESMATYVVAVPAAARNQLRIHRTVHKPALLETGASPKQTEDSCWSTCTQGAATIADCTIWDLKFAGDETLILLLSNQENRTFLLQFPVFRFSELFSETYHPAVNDTTFAQGTSGAVPPLEINNGSSQQRFESKTVQVNFSDIETYILHEFEAMEKANAFVPRFIQARGLERVAKQVLVLDEAATKYQVLDVSEIEWRWG